ncbi:hypothetical protein OIDMADRAFT_45283 [Oidiodendron maius Zn]|uniref:MmgE/PrpD C-terminal domain-containing protein n=1 Tax=Oidiodendron maius (strain Zn) TaxID=913774 RepID=A0A0C3C948_OIDMZ|nr:hypothetical protein OIDMADRAFT_45283 [Oidiodendron maius Zn]
MAGITTSSNGYDSRGIDKNGSVTTILAEFVSNTTYDTLSPVVVEKLKELLLDIIGVASAANGSWNKRLHPGFADHDALLCIALSEAGVLGSSKALEGRTGFLHSYSDTSDTTRLTKNLGKDWIMMGTALKPYPACRVTHASIDLAAKMAKEYGGPVEKITVALEQTGYTLVGLPVANKIRPENIVDAQFSNYIQTAIAWLYGNELGWSAYEKIFDKDAQELATRIEHVVDSSLPACGTRMTVLWPDGTQREEYMAAPLGELSNPFVFEKCTGKMFHVAF